MFYRNLESDVIYRFKSAKVIKIYWVCADVMQKISVKFILLAQKWQIPGCTTKIYFPQIMELS